MTPTHLNWMFDMKQKSEEQLQREIRRLKRELDKSVDNASRLSRLKDVLERKLETADADVRWYEKELDKIRSKLNEQTITNKSIK